MCVCVRAHVYAYGALYVSFGRSTKIWFFSLYCFRLLIFVLSVTYGFVIGKCCLILFSSMKSFNMHKRRLGWLVRNLLLMNLRD